MRRGLVKALPTLLAVPSAAVVGGIVYTSLLRERQSSHFQAQSRTHSGDLTPRDAPKGSWQESSGIPWQSWSEASEFFTPGWNSGAPSSRRSEISSISSPSAETSYTSLQEKDAESLQGPLLQEEAVPASTSGAPSAGGKSAAELAAEHSDRIAHLKEKLALRNVKLPAYRFDETGAELFRYSGTYGVLKASSSESLERAADVAASRVAETVDWLETHTFLTEEQLQSWSHLVSWAGEDEEGRPMMMIRMGRAIAECSRGEKRPDDFAEAIITLTQQAVEGIFSNSPAGPEQMVVVMDCSGATSMQITKMVFIIKKVSLTLNKHYPARLHRMFLVDAPTVVRWPLQAVKNLLHPATASKIILCPRGTSQRLPYQLPVLANSVSSKL